MTTTLFQTKLRPEDFIVSEILPFEPTGRGDFHYIYFEKKGLTTFLLIDLMIKQFGLNKNMIGIAGLKDKHAITRQWISLSKRDVIKMCGGINPLLSWLRTKGRVITATYGDHMLKLGENAGNHFDIVLVARGAFSNATKKNISEALQTIKEKGVPNFFGEQRFGHGGNNRMVGRELLAGTIRNISGDKNTLAEKRFKVQAYASYVFNTYLTIREKKGALYTELTGDILDKKTYIPMGPIPGDDFHHATGDALLLEQEVWKKLGITSELMKRFKVFGLYGIRRPIRVLPTDMTASWERNNVRLSFVLPSGAYATVVIDALENMCAGHSMNVEHPHKPLSEKQKGAQQPKHQEGKKQTAVKKSSDAMHHMEKKPLKDKRSEHTETDKEEKRPRRGINPYTGQRMSGKKKKTDAKRSPKNGGARPATPTSKNKPTRAKRMSKKS